MGGGGAEDAGVDGQDLQGSDGLEHGARQVAAEERAADIANFTPGCNTPSLSSLGAASSFHPPTKPFARSPGQVERQ